MSPLVRRSLVAILVVGALSVTLFAAPAYAAGATDYAWQSTTAWSVFSLDFWMDFASSLFDVDLSGAETVADSPSGELGTVFDRSISVQEPNGFYDAGLITDDSRTLVDGQN